MSQTLQVLLHDSTEVPLVKDLGFAVGAGTHALVGVKRKEVGSARVSAECLPLHTCS